MDDWLTVEDVSEYLKVKPRTVRRWLQEGQLNGVNLGGRAGWRIRKEHIEQFLDERDPTKESDPS